MKRMPECSCEPSMRELRAQREQRIMYDRKPAQFVESMPGPKNKAEDKRRLKPHETLFRTGNRITPPTARVKICEWSRLKLPHQTSPGALKLTCLSANNSAAAQSARSKLVVARQLPVDSHFSVLVQYVTPRYVSRCLLLHQISFARFTSRHVKRKFQDTRIPSVTSRW